MTMKKEKHSLKKVSWRKIRIWHSLIRTIQNQSIKWISTRRVKTWTMEMMTLMLRKYSISTIHIPRPKISFPHHHHMRTMITEIEVIWIETRRDLCKEEIMQVAWSSLSFSKRTNSRTSKTTMTNLIKTISSNREIINLIHRINLINKIIKEDLSKKTSFSLLNKARNFHYKSRIVISRIVLLRKSCASSFWQETVIETKIVLFHMIQLTSLVSSYMVLDNVIKVQLVSLVIRLCITLMIFKSLWRIMMSFWVTCIKEQGQLTLEIISQTI
jgi:hypothetical protein